MRQERVQKQKSAASHEQEAPAESLPEAKKPTVLDGLDELLEEIDGVLEENAEEFVKDYVQKGGE
jgi:prokaryotic ubiquitin-like protein Pup